MYKTKRLETTEDEKKKRENRTSRHARALIEFSVFRAHEDISSKEKLNSKYFLVHCNFKKNYIHINCVCQKRDIQRTNQNSEQINYA